jgi:hypothetical protein
MRKLFRLPFVLCCAMLAVAGACKWMTGPEGPPPQMLVCEKNNSTVCGTWTRNGNKYSATWEDGATAYITVVRFQPGHVEFRRVDFGKNPDFTATYIGTISGRTAAGTVTWSMQGTIATGTWTSEW